MDALLHNMPFLVALDLAGLALVFVLAHVALKAVYRKPKSMKA